MEITKDGKITVLLKYEEGDIEKMAECDDALMAKFIEDNMEIGYEEHDLTEFALNMLFKHTFGLKAFYHFMRTLGVEQLILGEEGEKQLKFDFSEEPEDDSEDEQN